jgi:hypothetical protein
MSPRAAWRLEQLGFQVVYDFAHGKEAWFGSGRPSEGEVDDTMRVGSLAEPLPSCGVDDDASRLDLQGQPIAVVLTGNGVVVGTISAKKVASAGAGTKVGDVMRSGPSTFRPSLPIHEAHHYAEEHDLQRLLITTLDGRWVGAVRRDALS